jgi:hypothetical protein
MKHSALPLVLGVYDLVKMWRKLSRLQALPKGFGSIAGAVGGHEPLDGDAKACVVGQWRL